LLEEGRGCFYAAEPDSDFETDSYDPTRECYHIDGAVETTDETQDAAAGGRAPAAREDPRTPGNDGQVDPPPQEDRAAQLAQLRELKMKLDEDRERLVLLEQILEQDLPYPPGGRSTTGSIWLGSSRVISKGLTYGPGTRGTSASANRSQEKLFESMLDASRSSAPSCHISPTTT